MPRVLLPVRVTSARRAVRPLLGGGVRRGLGAVGEKPGGQAFLRVGRGLVPYGAVHGEDEGAVAREVG